MEKNHPLCCVNALTLKLLAMALMLCDHLWATIIPGNQWMTNIGRLAFPIFAFQIAEGFDRTKSFKRYFLRMLLFALLSEIPFNLMYGSSVFYPFHQNVLFTFCIALLTLKMAQKGLERKGFWGWAAAGLSLAAGWLFGTLAMTDYGGWGVLTVCLFYFARKIPFGWLMELAGMILINGFMMQGMEIPVSIGSLKFFFPQQAFAVLALIPIWMYNGKSGPKNKAVQYFCYAFYPLHCLILFLLWRYVL